MPNRLIHEQSPYLLQHAHNPVEWYPWGDEAFELAKKLNKPLIVSIGYAACHWCHVMERESFENEAIAAYMNENFVCIKVDREEHPDVDHMYMDAVQAISGSGGWPLNVFVTPDRVPFYGGTYYPPRPAFNRQSWIQVMQRMAEIWHQQPDEIAAQTGQMLQYLRQASTTAVGGTSIDCDWDTCRQMADTLLKQADKVNGGFGNAPKFPGTMAISFLLEHFHYTDYKPALDQALLSLDKMIEGGIYDQIGGGFARYATDNNWRIPHFEKMLYDNALLLLSLCDAYSITKQERYKEVIQETLAFTERELKDASGGYYAALDADSEGEEGKYYTWTWQEWENVLANDDEIAAQYFGITEEGNWEHTNILHVAKRVEDIAKEKNIPPAEVQQKISEAKEKLFIARQKRVRPLTDDKCLLGWNALLNIAFTRCATVLNEPVYLMRAVEHMQWIQNNFWSEGVLLHSWKNNKARIIAKLDDHAYLIQAMLQLASASGNNELIVRANELMIDTLKNFLHEDGNFFYYSSSIQQDIPVRKVDVYDGAIPSANAVMAHNLLLLGICMEESAYNEQASFMLQKISSTTLRYTYSFGYWAILLQRNVKSIKSVICTGVDATKTSNEIRKYFIPEGYLLTSGKEIFDLPVFKDKKSAVETLIFVCTQQACLAPATNITEALALLTH